MGDQWCPITYFSKQLQPTQTQFSTFDRELLAIYLSIKHFRHYIEGRQFSVYTDSKPFTYALLMSSDKHTSRQIHHLNLISQLTSGIRRVELAQNGPADALLCLHMTTLHVEVNVIIDFKELAATQENAT